MRTQPAARRFFISYSHAERAEVSLAKWFHDALLRVGHHSFIDAGMPLGVKWSREVERNLDECDYFVVLLSDAAVHSEMVIEEVRRANALHKKHQRPQLIPLLIRYDGDFGYHLGAIINPLQWERWESDQDSEPILQKILQLAAGESPLPAAPPAKRRAAKSPRKVEMPRPSPMAAPAPSGSIWADDPLYLTRDADGTVSKLAASHGVTLVIEAPRQIGKSSLLHRYLAASQHAGKKVAMVDLAGFSFASFDDLLTAIAVELCEELDLDDAEPEIEGPQKFTLWVPRNILKRLESPITVAFDEADSVFDQDYRESFFAMLRGWHNRRARLNSHWRMLDLAMVISTEPHLLIDKPTLSPFNVGAHIRLPVFTREECLRLNQPFWQPALHR